MWAFRRRSSEGVEEAATDGAARPRTDNQSDAARTFALGDRLERGGAPLEGGLRSEMEGRLGHDLGGVRTHSDARAADSARELGASAYTVGQHVVFGEGAFAPSKPEGRELLAHELTHTVQQSSAGPVPTNAAIPVEPPATGLERDATANAPRAPAPRVAVQRQPAPQAKDPPSITVFVADDSKRHDVHFARKEAKADAADLRKKGTLSQEDRQLVNAKLKFFQGDAWRTYRDEIKPALLEVTREEIEMQAEWMGASGPGAKKNKGYAREQGEQDAQRIRAEGILSDELHEELNEKLRFFEDDAWQIYSDAIKPALVDAKKAEAKRDYEGMVAFYTSERESQLEARDMHFRSLLPDMTRGQIRNKWDGGKQVFLEVAQSPNNGLHREQMLEIWRLYWIDRVHAADEHENEIARTHHGDLERAHRELEATRAMLAGIVDADTFLAIADIDKMSVTLHDVDEAVVAAARFREGIGLLAMALGGGAPPAGEPPVEPVPAEPAPPAPPAQVPSKPVAGFRPPGAPEPAPAPPAQVPSKPVAGFRPPGAPAPKPQEPPTHVSPPVAGFGRERVQPEPIKPSPAEPPTRTQMPPARQVPSRPAPSPRPPTRRYEPPRAGGGRVTPADQARIRELTDWEKGNKVSGDVPGLARRLRSDDAATRDEARVEFEETKARVAKGEKVEIEEYAKKPKPREERRVQRISTPEKEELEDSGWLKKRLPDERDRREFMDWLKKGHKEGELGTEVPAGGRQTEGHEHLRPGSPEAEARVREWERERGRRR